MKAAKPKKTEEKLDSKKSAEILRIVSANSAFYFFTDLGSQTDQCSVCLTDFYNTVKNIDAKSLEFHFKRGDFSAWIRETLGDSKLADKIDKIDKTAKGEDLRKLLTKAVLTRVSQLKKAQASEESVLERSE